MKALLPLICGIGIGLGAGVAAAEGESAPSLPASCEIVDSSEIIHLVLCDAVFDSAGLADVGKAACSDKLPCGAWIYFEKAAMPDVAPENHDGLTQAQVVGAEAVWVAEQQNLIEISKVK